MTDERLGPDLAASVCALPRGSGVVLRHYHLPPAARKALSERLFTLCRRRGYLLVVADPPPGTRADGVHLPARTRRRARGQPPRPVLVTAAVHSVREAARARALGADLLFVSPVFATASHPGAQPIGPLRFAFLARRARRPVIALGGMTPSRFRRLKGLGARGFAAIHHWTPARPPTREEAQRPA